MHVHQIQMKGARGAFRSTTKRCIAIQDEKQIARRSRPKQGTAPTCKIMLHESAQSCHLSSLRKHMALLRWHACMQFHILLPFSPVTDSSSARSMAGAQQLLFFAFAF
jgi:hypothetical protein